MNNPMLHMLNRNGMAQLQSNINGIKQLMNTVRGMRSPQGMIQTMLMQNPQMRQAMEYVKQNGGDAQKAFYSLAEQNVSNHTYNPINDGSEFLLLASKKDLNSVLQIVDELMDTIKTLHPRMYDAVMRRMYDL